MRFVFYSIFAIWRACGLIDPRARVSIHFDRASYCTAYSQFGPLVGLSVQGGRVFMNFERASYFTTYSQFGALAGLSVQGARVFMNFDRASQHIRNLVRLRVYRSKGGQNEREF